MYPGDVVGGSMAVGGGALAATGTSPWLLVAGVTLVLAGLALTRLVPKRRRSH